MATATKLDNPVVTLSLTEDEAKTLADILSCIGGSPSTTRRRFTQSIANALADAGYTYNFEEITDLSPNAKVIYFREN